MADDERRLRRIAETASAFSATVIVLVALGYWFCVWLFFASPWLVPAPSDSWVPNDPGSAMQASVASLVYWVLAFSVALGLAVVITVLGVRALQRLWECSAESLIVERSDELDPAVTLDRLDREGAPGQSSPGVGSGENR
ncbi:hypothetical protein [Leifsonia poae]|uniref:hypothetical protein n=1 Tax=Leifsonia poae TaxID=110933 RepID=UPI001CBC46A7|nr:hypothetical protein [Leifsonia poae]